MEIKTCEQYILNELSETQRQLELSNEKIAELEEQLNSNPSSETVDISRTSNIFYSYNVTSKYYMKEILEKASSDENILNYAYKCLKNKTLMIDLMEKHSKYGYSENKVSERNYQFLVVYAGRDYAIHIYGEKTDECDIHCLDDKNFYHADKKALAYANMCEEFRNNLEKWINEEMKKQEEMQNVSE